VTLPEVTAFDGDQARDVGEALESIGAKLVRAGHPSLAPREIVRRFTEATPALVSGERAELLGHLMEDQEVGASATASAGGSLDLGQLFGSAGRVFQQAAPYVQRGIGVVQQGAQAIQQFSGGRPPSPRGGADAGGRAQAGSDPLAQLLRALQLGQVPPMPGPGAGARRRPAAPAARQMDATALLSLFLSMPQVQRSLQSAAVLGPASPRTVKMPMPPTTAGGGQRNVSIPLGGVLNALGGLIGQAMEEINACASEADPELPDYLVGGDGRLMVDPASPEERAALVTHLFRVSSEARRAGLVHEADDDEDNETFDELEAWAFEAGLER
jgi:hypothetical protein